MKTAIIGSRSLTIDISEFVPDGTNLIISGGAKGIDTMAEKYADERSIPKLIFKPEYNKYGASATLVRNRSIVEASDIVIAIWDGESSGTKYMIEYAKKVGKPANINVILK